MILRLLSQGDGAQRAAEIHAGALPHLDDGQHAGIEAYQIDFAGLAAQVAGEHEDAARLEVLCGEPLGGGAALRGRCDHWRDSGAFGGGGRGRYSTCLR